jgi:hypothetical protein
MAESMGIPVAAQRVAQPSIPSAPVAAATTVQQLANVPGLVRVQLPIRQNDDQPRRPRKPAARLQAPRDLNRGFSPFAPAAIANAGEGADLIGKQGSRDGGTAKGQGAQSQALTPNANGVIAYANTENGTVFLEKERWFNHIRTNHVIDPPTGRRKGQQTWWPVQYSANGQASMDETHVVSMTMDAVRNGTWKNAMKGTLAVEYAVPQDQADQTGVSEVLVSVAPTGRILSSYPTKGNNVLAVRAMTDDEFAAVHTPAQSDPDAKLFQTRVSETTFG